jgi:hypothetical protein
MAVPLGYGMEGGYGACGSMGLSVYDTLYIAQHGTARSYMTWSRHHSTESIAESRPYVE